MRLFLHILLIAGFVTSVTCAPRVKRQYYDYSNYYGYQYRQPYTMSYFRGQPVYPYNYGIYSQPNYGYNYYNYYQRQPAYYRSSNWEMYPQGYADEGNVVYYDNSYYGGGILGAAGAFVRSVLG